MLIADSPDLLTPEWLSQALGATVTGVTASPVGTGQMCDSLRLELAFDGDRGDLPATVIAKLPAADPTSRATGLSLRNYEREVRFYQELAPRLPIRTPAAHHADVDVATGSFVLLLEDLSPAAQGDQLVGASAEQAEVAVAELVKLHAPHWGDPALAEIEWLHGDPDTGRATMVQLLPMLWGGFTARYAARLGPEVVEVGNALFGGIASYIYDESQPLTINHGDYRLDNLLFATDAGGVPVAVVDWQTVTHGAGLADVAYFIGAGLLPDARREAEERLVRGYYDALLAAGVEDYPWELCWEGYRRGTFAGLIVTVGASMLVEQTERGDDMFMAMAHRHAQHALDHDAIALLTQSA